MTPPSNPVTTSTESKSKNEVKGHRIEALERSVGGLAKAQDKMLAAIEEMLATKKEELVAAKEIPAVRKETTEIPIH